MLKFFQPLKSVVFDPNKDYDFRRNFFITQCKKFPNVFNSMLLLKSKGEGKREGERGH